MNVFKYLMCETRQRQNTIEKYFNTENNKIKILPLAYCRKNYRDAMLTDREHNMNTYFTEHF